MHLLTLEYFCKFGYVIGIYGVFFLAFSGQEAFECLFSSIAKHKPVSKGELVLNC